MGTSESSGWTRCQRAQWCPAQEGSCPGQCRVAAQSLRGPLGDHAFPALQTWESLPIFLSSREGVPLAPD